MNLNIDMTMVGTWALFAGAMAFLIAFLILVSRDVRRRHIKKESRERMHQKWNDLVELNERRQQPRQISTERDVVGAQETAQPARPRLATR